jgi:hypothetical protein
MITLPDDDDDRAEIRYVDTDDLPADLPKDDTVAREPGDIYDSRAQVTQVARDVAAYLLHRRCIYKDKAYLGPVTVDVACANQRRILVSMITQPWSVDGRSCRITMDMPVSALWADAFSVTLNVGYGLGGILVHDADAVSAIDTLSKGGASKQQLLHAVNHCEGLPDHVAALRDHPLPTVG